MTHKNDSVIAGVLFAGILSSWKGHRTRASIAPILGVSWACVDLWLRAASLPPRTRLPALAAALGRPVAEIEAIVAADRAARAARESKTPVTVTKGALT